MLFKKNILDLLLKINRSNDLYVLVGTVKTISQYNKVKKIMDESNLTDPFITKINTSNHFK